MLKKLIQLRVKYDSGILSPIIISFTASEGKENNSEVSPGLFERIDQTPLFSPFLEFIS